MNKSQVFCYLGATLTLGLVFATSHAFADDVSERVSKIPTIAVLPQQGPPQETSSFLRSLSDADEGEYVIFNGKGEPEAAVVVTQDSSKATEETNIRSIYTWMQKYIDKTKLESPVEPTRPEPTSYSQQFPTNNNPALGYSRPSQQVYRYPAPYSQQYNPYAMPVTPYKLPYDVYSNQRQSYGTPYFMNSEYPPTQYQIYDRNSYKPPTHTQRYPIMYTEAPHQNTYPLKKRVTIRGAHTTPNGQPWSPLESYPLNSNMGAYTPVYQVFQEAPIAVGSWRMGAVSNKNTGTKYVPKPASNQNMFYRAWLANQATDEVTPFRSQGTRYSDENLSAYLMSKFAPLVSTQRYTMKETTVDDRDNFQLRRIPAGYQEIEDATPVKKYTKYRPVSNVNNYEGVRFSQNDRFQGPYSKYTYSVETPGGQQLKGSPYFDALKALTGYSKNEIDKMIDGRKEDVYLRFAKPQDAFGDGNYNRKKAEFVIVPTNEDGRVKSTTGLFNPQTTRRVTYPQLYLFPGTNVGNEKYPAYKGGSDIVDFGVVFTTKVRSTTPPKRNKNKRPATRKNPNEELVKLLRGYSKQQLDDLIDGKKPVNYPRVYTAISGVNDSGKKRKRVQQSPTRKTAMPQYFMVEVDDASARGVKQGTQQGAVPEYTSGQMGNVIANNLRMYMGDNGSLRGGQSQNTPKVEPWQQLRNSERTYQKYDQPWTYPSVFRTPASGFGF